MSTLPLPLPVITVLAWFRSTGPPRGPARVVVVVNLQQGAKQLAVSHEQERRHGGPGRPGFTPWARVPVEQLPRCSLATGGRWKATGSD